MVKFYAAEILPVVAGDFVPPFLNEMLQYLFGPIGELLFHRCLKQALMNIFPSHCRIWVITLNLSHIGYVIHSVQSRFDYGARVYPISITHPAQKTGLPYNNFRYPN